jgi:hypothetical protein
LPRLDPNDDGNAHLQALVRRLHPDDVRAFVGKLTTQSLGPRFHTYRELLVGVHLRDRGFDVRYERALGNQTPDWSLVSAEGSTLEVLDVLTVHQRHHKDSEIRNAIGASRRWSGWITVPPDHIYRKLSDKVGQYSRVARDSKLPYVLAVYGDFNASISPEEMEYVLFSHHGGWFKSAAEVSGLLYFRQTMLRFEYTYYMNPHATIQSAMLPSQASKRDEA